MCLTVKRMRMGNIDKSNKKALKKLSLRAFNTY